MPDFVRAIRAAEIAPGGMRAVEIDGHELVVCNHAGTFRALDRRCGHMNAPLELGTLNGAIVTCPLHCAQFDVVRGEALSGPVPHDLAGEQLPPRIQAYLESVGFITRGVRTESIRTYTAKTEETKQHCNSYFRPVGLIWMLPKSTCPVSVPPLLYSRDAYSWVAPLRA